MVTEMESSAKHAHIQLWFDEPKRKGDIKKQIERICSRTIEDWSEAEKRVLAQGVKIGYSDWYIDYLLMNDLKSDDPCVLVDNPPPTDTFKYYPTEEEQEKVQAQSNAVDQQMFKLEQMYLDGCCEPGEITLQSVGNFLSDQMFCKRTIMTVRQPRDRHALCKTLHAYMNKTVNSCLFIPEPKTHVGMNEKLETLNLPQVSWD